MDTNDDTNVLQYSFQRDPTKTTKNLTHLYECVYQYI